jgi:hypothetical protein
LAVARPVFAPLTFALLVIAILWPLQSRLQARLPKLLALALSMLGTMGSSPPSVGRSHGASAGPSGISSATPRSSNCSTTR